MPWGILANLVTFGELARLEEGLGGERKGSWIVSGGLKCEEGLRLSPEGLCGEGYWDGGWLCQPGQDGAG